MYRPQRQTRSKFPTIPEVEEPQPEITAQNITAREITPQNVKARETEAQKLTDQEIPVSDAKLSKEVLQIEQVRTEDISDGLTQKIETLSQVVRKRTSVRDAEPSPKRRCSIGYVTFRRSQKELQKQQQMWMEADVQQTLVPQAVPELNLDPIEADEENVPQNYQIRRIEHAEKRLSGLLKEAGLADVPPLGDNTPQGQRTTRDGSSGSETPLGSLDRTKVSLGDSTHTTDSKRMIRDQWGSEGTMIKIINSIKEDREPVTVENLVKKGPLITGYKRIIAAKCFNSILKLKQHSFIIVKKNPKTLKVEDIKLGPRFD